VRGAGVAARKVRTGAVHGCEAVRPSLRGTGVRPYARPYGAVPHTSAPLTYTAIFVASANVVFVPRL
jgi:hypothetical protein